MMSSLSTRWMFDRAVDQLGATQVRLAKVQAQVASGKAVNQASDAPEAAVSIQRLRQTLARHDAYDATLGTLKDRLTAQETSVRTASTILARVRELALQSNNDTISPADRRAIAIEIRGLRDDLLAAANTQGPDGQRLFGGARTDVPPFVADVKGRIAYVGDHTRNQVAVGDGRAIDANRAGSTVFVTVPRTDASTKAVQGVGFFQVIDDLAGAIESSDRAAMNRGVDEVSALSDGLTQTLASIGTDLAAAQTQGDVLDETRLQLKTTLSRIEDLDYGEAVTRMKREMLALEASQSSFAQVSRLSLFNYLGG